MQTFSQTFAGADTWELNVRGSYFSLIDCQYPHDVRLYQGGKLLDLGEVKAIGAGLEVKLDRPAVFDRIVIGVSQADTITMGIGDGQARYNVRVAVPLRFAGTQTTRTVTNVSSNMISANPLRKYLLIQNRDPVGSIYINFMVAATVANGIEIKPGGSLELTGASGVSTNQVRAIGDLASNPNVITLEG